MKVTTDACLFGAWVAKEVESEKLKVESSLDIGTGTGLLALMIVQKINAEIDCVEIDAQAAGQAQENTNASPWKDRIRVMNANVKSISFEKKYDHIISNPPFYEKEIKSEKESKNVAHHSENLTLDELLTLIKENLNSDGNFYLLLPFKRNEEIKKLFKDHKLHISKLLLVRQSVKHDHFRIMIKGKLKPKENEATAFAEMSIWDGGQKYTTGFAELLKDYYLYL